MNEMHKETMKEKIDHVEFVLDQYIPKAEGYQKTVLDAMNYTMRAGGKRLRPMIMEETYRLFGGEDDSIIQPFMAAIEMIHTYSLIHDDLPALDNDDYRRGKKTAHIVYGEDMAILAGDALLNYAFETACKAFTASTQDITVAKAMKILTRKPGIYGMIGGQVADVEGEGKPLDMETILYIHHNKTAALIECAMMIGAILGGAQDQDVDKVEQIANYIGLAFQIQDDILDITSTTEVLGKPVGSDEKNEKLTYVAHKGLEQSAKDVASLTEKAIQIYDTLPGKNDFLRDLLLSLINRIN